MSRSQKLAVGVLAVAVVATAAGVGALRSQDQGVDVRVEEVEKRDIEATITAAGSVRARREVNVSSDVMGRVTELAVEEGEEVVRDQVLLRIDPSQIEATVARAEATLSQARANLAQQRAGLLQAERELERIRALRERDAGLASVQRLQDAETQAEVQSSLVESARHGVEQAEAGVEEAREQLDRTTIRSPMAGRVTRVNIDEGETVVVGTMNNPGSLLLTISDLSGAEAVLAVDETDIPRVAEGDSARVELDAFPGSTFSGVVSRIGSSSIQASSGGQPRPPSGASGGGSVDYEVVLTILDPPPLLRPDLTAIADIVVETRKNALAVPIIAVTVPETTGDEEPVEGVFLVREGVARFQRVELGLTGREHFEVVSGLSAGESIVAGPFEHIRQLRDGDRIHPVAAGTVPD